MCFSGGVSPSPLLLLLLLLLSDWLLVTSQVQVVGGLHEDHGAGLRSRWRQYMKESQLREKDPGLGGGNKQLLLYCRVGIGFHLQILSNGSVGGVHRPNEYCGVRVTSIRRGVIAILGVKSGRYLCMNAEGRTYAAETFSDDCLLCENLEENHFTTYSSLSHPGLYVALSRKGRLRNGRRAKAQQACSHFLPRRTSL